MAEESKVCGILCVCSGQIQNELVELRVIDRINFSQHRSLSGNVRLPWKSEELDGSVEVRLNHLFKNTSDISRFVL